MYTETLLETTSKHNLPTDQLDFAALLEDYVPAQIEKGQYVAGEILQIDQNVILANVDAKRTAVVPRQDIARLKDHELEKLAVGDEIMFYVLRTPVGNEDLLVSINKGLEHQDWGKAEACLASEELVELEVVGHNKGGMIAAFGHLRGFIPISHIPQLQNNGNAQLLNTQKAKLIGTTLSLKVIEVDRHRRRLILSAKKAQKEARVQRIKELKELEGETITGRITNLVHFGAFVDLSGMEGLIHISEIAWEQVNKPSQFLNVGDDVEVLIKHVDVEEEKVSLSRKDLLPNPWTRFAETSSEGDLVEGVVTSVTEFGAFAQIADGIEGLIHVSEIRGPQQLNPEDVLHTGDIVLVRILSIEADRQRLGLSQRKVRQDEETEWIWQKQAALSTVEA